MPAPGRQEQTLVYRVELDESSVAQIIRTARESVGVGLQQAAQVGSDSLAQGQLTTATAIAQVGSHLEFLQRTRSALAAPGAMRDGAAGMSIAQALGVKAGLVTPRFSESQRSLEHRANSVLGGAYSTGGLEAMETGASVGLAAAGVAAMFMGPVGWAGIAAIGVAELGLDAGISSSFERAIGRRQIGGHLRRFGFNRSMEIARQFEGDISGMQGSFEELSGVAQAALTNIRFRPGQDVNSALVSAIGDWRAAGKSLGLEKEDALATVGELYRAGFQPGAAGSYLARVGAVSDMMGFNPSAVNAGALQFGRSAATQGFDVVQASNAFMTEMGTMSLMAREGVISRGDLTAAAGFAGPEAEQIRAATMNRMGQTMRLQQTGFGRAIALGAGAGGRGGFRSMVGAAAGATTQEILELDSSMLSMASVQATEAGAVDLARQVITGMGGEVTQAALSSRLMRFGYDVGTARVMAAENMNPSMRGIQNMMVQRRQAEVAIESSARSSIIGEVGSDIGRRGGDVAEALYSGVSSRTMMGGPMAWMGGPNLSPTAWAMGGFEAQRGTDYRGIRGFGRFASDAFDSTFGEVGRDISEGFGAFGRWIGGLFGYERESAGRGRALATRFSRAEIEGMSTRDMRRRFQRVSDLRSEYADMFEEGGKRPEDEAIRGGRFQGFLRQREQQIYKDILDSNTTRRLQVRGDRDLLQDELGVDIGEDEMMGLLAQTERVRRRIQGAGTTEEREGIIADFRGTLKSMDFMRGANIDQGVELLLHKTSTRFTQGESNQLRDIQDAQATAAAFDQALGSRTSRMEIARKYLKEGSAAAAELEGAENLSDRDFRRIITRASAGGQLKRGVAASLRDVKGGSLAERVQADVMMSVAEDVAMARGVKDEAEGPERQAGAAAAAGDLDSLVGTFGETNKLLRQLISKLDMS